MPSLDWGTYINKLRGIGKTDSKLDCTAATARSGELFQYTGGQWGTLLSCKIDTSEASNRLGARGLMTRVVVGFCHPF